MSTGLAARLSQGLRPYVQKEPLAALMLGISSGFPYAMIGATLTTRLAQDGIDKKAVTAFSLAFLVYNFKFLWAPLVDSVRLPLLGRLGQRVSWLVLAGVLAMLAVAWLAVPPLLKGPLERTATAMLSLPSAIFASSASITCPLAGWPILAARIYRSRRTPRYFPFLAPPMVAMAGPYSASPISVAGWQYRKVNLPVYLFTILAR